MKEDLKRLESSFDTRLSHAISDLRKDMEVKFASIDAKNEIIKRDIIIKLTAVVLGTAGFMLAAVKFLF